MLSSVLGLGEEAIGRSKAQSQPDEHILLMGNKAKPAILQKVIYHRPSIRSNVPPVNMACHEDAAHQIHCLEHICGGKVIYKAWILTGCSQKVLPGTIFFSFSPPENRVFGASEMSSWVKCSCYGNLATEFHPRKLGKGKKEK